MRVGFFACVAINEFMWKAYEEKYMQLKDGFVMGKV